MKLFYRTLLGGMVFGVASPIAFAQQQLPNSDFEGEWTDCVPWTSKDNTTVVTQKIDDVTVTGKNPSGWCISHVIGINGLGATLVGNNEPGYESTSAIKLSNSPNSLLSTQTVPGYISLGKTWSTSVMGSQNDGGSFGGVEFNGRPSGIEFMYKRSRGTSKPDEKTTVVAYIWKGHVTQKDVPGNIEAFGTPKAVDMIDRDRCVLQMDMSGSKGGEVVPSADFELIAVVNADITDDASEWTKFHADFDYKSDAMPEMINVIIAAGDYFGGAEVLGQGNTITIDNVKLLYAEQANKYDGYLNVEMKGQQIALNQPSTIEITPTTDGKCDFLLPNLTLSMEGRDMPLGDIKLKDVTVTEVNGIKTYAGEEKGMQLMGDFITADVTLAGSIDGDKVNMKIDVTWNGIPINVTFTSKTSSIDSIGIDNINATVEYFNLQGAKVNKENLTPGIYIKRHGDKSTKIYVK